MGRWAAQASVGGHAPAEIPESPLPVRYASLGAAGRALPGNCLVVGDAGVHAAIVAFAALEARRTRGVFGTVEVRSMRDHRGDEYGARGSPLGCDVALFVEVVPGVDHVHGSRLIRGDSKKE